MAFCSSCGNQIADGAKFCPACGANQQEQPGISQNASGFSVQSQGTYIPGGTFSLKNVHDNPNMKKLTELGNFIVFEHEKDLSSETDPIGAYFRSQMNVKLRQVLIKLNNSAVKTQAGAMQWFAGSVECDTGLGSGVSAIGKFIKGKVAGMASGESAVKPRYRGTGYVMLEPTYKHIILLNAEEWGPQGVVLQDGLFLACDEQLQEQIVSRKKLSGLFAGEGLFNLNVSGQGTLVLESPVPYEELIVFELQNSEVKIDGNMAIAWSNSLELTVERSSKSLLGSMVNKEGLLNVYRGTGKVLMAPVANGSIMEGGTTKDVAKAEGGSATGSVVKGIVSMITD